MLFLSSAGLELLFCICMTPALAGDTARTIISRDVSKSNLWTRPMSHTTRVTFCANTDCKGFLGWCVGVSSPFSKASKLQGLQHHWKSDFLEALIEVLIDGEPSETKQRYPSRPTVLTTLFHFRKLENCQNAANMCPESCPKDRLLRFSGKVTSSKG